MTVETGSLNKIKFLNKEQILDKTIAKQLKIIRMSRHKGWKGINQEGCPGHRALRLHLKV